MGRLSRAKGNSFERLVAKMILKAAGKRFTNRDCFRTPLSGGHGAFSSSYPGDVYISDDLRRWFPYVVECKQDKGWTERQFLTNGRQWDKWFTQAVNQAMKVGSPLLVVRGNRTPVYALVLYERQYKSFLAGGGVQLVNNQGVLWLMVEFRRFLKFLEGKKEVVG